MKKKKRIALMYGADTSFPVEFATRVKGIHIDANASYIEYVLEKYPSTLGGWTYYDEVENHFTILSCSHEGLREDLARYFLEKVTKMMGGGSGDVVISGWIVTNVLDELREIFGDLDGEDWCFGEFIMWKPSIEIGNDQFFSYAPVSKLLPELVSRSDSNNLELQEVGLYVSSEEFIRYRVFQIGGQYSIFFVREEING